ncbi:MAG: indole-3-glycerol-phosphate synthase [Pseudomonadota bacterium]
MDSMAPAESFLERMAESSAERASLAKQHTSIEELKALGSKYPTFTFSHLDQAFNIIAEVKLRSPSAGTLAHENHDYVSQAVDYAKGGASAISVLTEPDAFNGSLAHLANCVKAVSEFDVPVMRKDFLVDPFQLYEAKAHGASGVLLIVRILSDDALLEMMDVATELNLFALIEAFDEDDLQRCRQLQDVFTPESKNRFLVGVNCRDLVSLEIKPQRFKKCVSGFPSSVFKVAESGLLNADDVARVAQQGYDMALIGSALMQTKDPQETLAEMLLAARDRKAT